MVREADRSGGALVLGGGSNLVVADAGVTVPVVRIANVGVRIDDGRTAKTGDDEYDVNPAEADADAIATIAAGVTWDDAVEEIVSAGYSGVEALSGIPGLAGATPVQNVGAYGTEIADVLVDVELFARAADPAMRRGLYRLPASRLGLTYRHSLLKGTDAAVVTELRLRLWRAPSPVRYPELAALLGVAVGDTAPPAAVRAAVLELRRRKGMVLDPADPDTRSAGSFFTNPIVTSAQLSKVRQAAAERLGPAVRMPEYPAAAGSADTKLSAAWLIEQAGFAKGFPLTERPDAGISLSTKHTLALTNRGHGSTAELLALAREIRSGVAAAFGVILRPEPLLIGCEV